MPSNSYPIEKRGAFYLEEAGINSMISAVTKFTEASYNISATFDDGFTHTTKDVSTLINHPHFRSSCCDNLTISSTTSYAQPNSKDIRITCSKWGDEGRIKADISSDNDDLHIVRAELEREIKSSRTKFDFIYRVYSVFWFVSFSLIGIYLGTKIGQVLTAASKDQSREALSNLTTISLVIGIFPMYVLLYLLSKAKLIVFPCFTVAIGKAKEKYSALADTRKWAYRLIAASLAGYAIKIFAFPA